MAQSKHRPTRTQASPPKATFERCADASLAATRETYLQRGREYDDTWAVEHQISTFTRQVLRDAFGITNPDPKAVRLLLAAAIVDVKDSRMLGAFKPDTIVDGIAYRALFLRLREEFASQKR
jgi:hypothetical protein